LIYQGTAMGSGTDFSGRTLLHGFNIADTSWITTGTATSNISYLPTAINGLDRNLDSGNFDNAQYSGTRAGMTTAAYRASIGNIANYTQSDTRFDLTTDAFAINPSTEIHWDANGTTAGDGGTATWDTTTQSRFKNGAAGTTYLRWVNSSTGNDHTAVFGGTAGTVSVASGGVTSSGLTFNTTGYVVQSNTITLSGSTTPIISVGSGLTATINSALAGTSGFTKTGDGILVLGGDQTGLATTNVNGGTLIVNGDQSTATGAVSVADTTTLGGIGSVGGATTFASGSTLSPGTSAGNISQALDFASLTMAAGSFWLVDLVNAVANDSDLVSVVNSGGLSISGALTINEVSGTFTETTGYRIASYTGALGGLGRFSNDNGSGLITSGVGNTWSINYNNGGFITLTSLTAVPEPGTLGLLGVALGGFFVRRFRRRSSRDCTPGK